MFCKLVRLFREIFSQIHEHRAVPIALDDDEDDWEHA